jgi:hypothetical protein
MAREALRGAEPAPTKPQQRRLWKPDATSEFIDQVCKSTSRTRRTSGRALAKLALLEGLSTSEEVERQPCGRRTNSKRNTIGPRIQAGYPERSATLGPVLSNDVNPWVATSKYIKLNSLQTRSCLQYPLHRDGVTADFGIHPMLSLTLFALSARSRLFDISSEYRWVTGDCALTEICVGRLDSGNLAPPFSGNYAMTFVR